jgi:HK97 family phage portal protein
MAESPSGSIHRYFAWPAATDVDIRNSDSTLAPGVDIRANGGMVVAPPTRNEKGVYRWLNDLAMAGAPSWLLKLIEKGNRPSRPTSAPRNTKYKPIEDDQLRELMECVPNDDRTTWEDWNRVGMALYAATNGSGFGGELFDQWSERNDKYYPENTELKWSAYETSPPNNIGVGTLFFLAGSARFEAEMKALADLEARGEWNPPPAEEAFPDDLEDDDNDDDPPVNLWRAIDTPELPVGLLPARVEKFVRANAKALGADSGGLAGTSLAALAAAIPDSVKLQVQARGRKWLIGARIWIALVGDPSTKKTPIMDVALAALRAKDAVRRRTYAGLKAFWDAQPKKEKAQALAAGRRAMSFFSRALSMFRRAAPEGAHRPGPYFLSTSGGWLPDGAPLNWWQTGASLQGTGRSAILQACVSSYAQSISMCAGDHWRATPLGGRERVTNSAAARFLRKPNAYQSISDFLLNLVSALFTDGNTYALALRNDRFEIEEVHLMSPTLSRPVLSTDGEIFFRLAGNSVISRQIGNEILVPARDVLHLKLDAPPGREPWPLMGQSPLASLASELMTQGAINGSQANFYMNQARPSAVLSTDLVLDRAQVESLRQLWDEQSRGLKAGGTPNLTSGLKVQPWAGTFRDAQMAELLRLTDEHIALAYRIPLQILGLGGGSPAGSTEILMQNWVATGLGLALAHIEEGLGQFFRLKGQPAEYIEFSTEALLRSAYKDRIDALARGVQGGILSPNEARMIEHGTPKSEFVKLVYDVYIAGKLTEELLRSTFENLWWIAVITKEEDARLSSGGWRSKAHNHGPKARWAAVGIQF